MRILVWLLAIALESCMYDTKLADTTSPQLCRNGVDFKHLSIAAKEDCMNNNNAENKNQVKQRKRKRRVAYYHNKWPQSTDGFVYVPYIFTNLPGSSASAFEEAVQRYNRQTCIRLIPRRVTDAHFLEITSRPLAGCSSYVGMIGGAQELTLEEGGCDEPGIAQHEIMHALGFGHTMIRGDSNVYININWANIQSGFENNFRKHLTEDTDIYGEEFCYESIMMYGRYDFALDPNVEVLTPLNASFTGELGQRVDWAPCDVQQINRMYNCLDYLTIV